MAIHAMASSSAWDEQIVPALRKRLENESRTLSKRMSAVSITSLEDSPGPIPSSNTRSTLRDPTASPTFSVQSQKGSAIPRPSLQQSRTSAESSSRVYPNGLPPSLSKPPKRSRTYSQPYIYDPPNGTNGTQKLTTTNGSPMTPDSSGSTLPMYVSRTSDVKPTRIPKVARGRSGSTSSSNPQSNVNTAMSSEGRNGAGYGLYAPPTPETTPDLWTLKEAQSNRSRSTVSVASHSQHHTLMHETPPFTPVSISSAAQSHDHSQSYEDGMAPPRHSNDSEERPFEHWYRGEVSRNGGVGELRVGKRLEMLDIANYGHTLRKARTPANPRGVATSEDTARRRNRTNSVTGVGERESFYLDEERVNEEKRVLDETPLTDLEVDSEPEHDILDYYSTDVNGNDDSNVTTTQDLRSGTPTSHRSTSRAPRDGTTPSRIPTPAPRQSSEPPRTTTPTPPARGASEPPSFPPTPSSSHTPQQQPRGVPRSASQPNQSETQKRRAKSPTTASTSAAKRTKTSLSKAKKLRDEEANRRSVAYYPAPAGGDGDIMDAIPSWTQPVPASGNWDEVVLPVVARKKGLDEHYEKADGGPRPPKPSNRVEPAPGTFGFDYSKYRRSADEGDGIPMDEFGQRPIAGIVEEEDGRVGDSEKGRQSIHENKSSPIRTPVPLPQHRTVEVPTISLNGGGVLKGHQREDEVENEGGCCKCVIM